jgi:long-chain acyl-CoA synthetase
MAHQRQDEGVSVFSSDAPGVPATFWRVEGSLLNLTAVRPVAFFTWNAQSFLERWVRRWLMAFLALGRPFFYAANRVFATRALHTVLRGVSRDRLDLLGEEYFNYHLKPRLKRRGVEKLKECLAKDPSVILVSQGLDHIMRPLAQHLGVERLIANRLEFRSGLATGRLLEPVIRPRGGLAWLRAFNPDGRVPQELLIRKLGLAGGVEELESAITPAERVPLLGHTPAVVFDSRRRLRPVSVRRALAGKNILLIGGTGFIGKVFLAKLLTDLPDIGKVFMLIRPRATTGVQRFEKMVESSPVFDALQKRHGQDLEQYIGNRVEVVEGDVTHPGLGLSRQAAERLARTVDVIINSSGLTDFNPDLRTALAANVDGTLQVVEFLRGSDRAALLHLSTCYVVGSRDGRIHERIQPDYTPAGLPEFDAEREYESLQRLARDIEERAERLDAAELFEGRVKGTRPALEAAAQPERASQHLQKARMLWARSQLIEAGLRRARELGWPNTYTFTKSLTESLMARRGAGLPITIVRPSIVETSTQDPFPGWNEGVNTSAPLSFLLGTYFRQLPSNERKRLDLIPVDLVVRGMLLISAALVERRHEAVFQLATSDRSPCDMGRSIELTCLAHRKHYTAQQGLEGWMRARFDTISVSKARYQKLSAPGQQALLRAVLRSLPGLKGLARKERALEKVAKLIELYEPFILHNEQVFEAENIELLARGLPPDERAAFGYDAVIDWWEYWINIHVPALRKWSYPLIVGHPLEAPVLRSFRMPEATATGASR